MSKGMRTEDEVRDSAKLVLGFDKTEDGVQQGTGQITTFNQLGFRGCNDKPDGWYLPDDASKPAIILETKSETEGVSKEKHVKELFKNIDVVAKKYSKTIGILYMTTRIQRSTTGTTSLPLRILATWILTEQSADTDERIWNHDLFTYRGNAYCRNCIVRTSARDTFCHSNEKKSHKQNQRNQR